MRPLLLTWTDGKKYEIDRVTDVRQAHSLKGGGLGMRYTVRVRGTEVYLFEDRSHPEVKNGSQLSGVYLGRSMRKGFQPKWPEAFNLLGGACWFRTSGLLNVNYDQ